MGLDVDDEDAESRVACACEDDVIGEEVVVIDDGRELVDVLGDRDELVDVLGDVVEEVNVVEDVLDGVAEEVGLWSSSQSSKSHCSSYSFSLRSECRAVRPRILPSLMSGGT